MDASFQSDGCAPIAALLYDAALLPTLQHVLAEAERGATFAVSHKPAADDGWVELLRDGLTFDLHGLAGGPVQPLPEMRAAVGLDRAASADLGVLTLAPGPHLAGAQRLLPVIRVAADLLADLARIGPATAIVWLPAKLMVRADLFEKAVRPWLQGGPFPAPAFVAIHSDGAGGLRSEGLNFFIEQEFSLVPGSTDGASALSRVAIRLIDWLVAHGPISSSTDAVLAGTGAVFLEVPERGRILARCN
ncbi:hypothetical protein [Novosphingobium sp.]|uniref:hypothetical protein n=1 Tax=Novosphingobium sp. TaxID=1874826 RepID=UPI00262A470A|nr:hypothetical protein [Novosphingobium sp.]